jgi:hypothetical protein
MYLTLTANALLSMLLNYSCLKYELMKIIEKNFFPFFVQIKYCFVNLRKIQNFLKQICLFLAMHVNM